MGAERVVAWAAALIVCGTALRAVAGVVWLYAGTVVAGVGLAVAGALLPSLVKERFPDRIGPVTGVYTACLIGGALLGGSLTEPMRGGLGLPWPGALAVWALPALVALAAIAPLARPAPAVNGPADRLPWRDRTAWLVTVYMGVQSLLFYAALAWLPARYTSLGTDPAGAGLLLGVFTAPQIVAALGMPVLAHRYGDRRPWVALSSGLCVVAFVGVALLPTAAPWLWATMLGFGVGGLFALALMMIAEHAATPGQAAALSGMAFFVGYLVAALGPVAAGALRDATGGYAVPFLALAGLAVVTLVIGVLAAGRR
jgi:CP family cyanate transporter-like MFS transporter